MKALVDRFGRTGAAALTSLMWALPMAAWAGSSDLSPIDQTAYPWVALSIGVVMLAAWLVLVVRIARTQTDTAGRKRRLDIGQMSSTERRWALATFAFACGAIAWLNGAATVDWTPLLTATAQGKPGPSMFAAALALFLLVMLAGAALSWRSWSRAFARRR
jgi:Na+/melibiose symporter-like transporter